MIGKKYKKHYSIVIFFSLFLLPFLSCEAISLDKNTYKEDENIIFKDSGGFWNVYDLTDKTLSGGDESYFVGGFLAFEKKVNHIYSILETKEGNVCENPIIISYEECKKKLEFVSDFIFRIDAGKSIQGGPNELETIVSYKPEVEIYSPIDTRTYGNNIDIIYEVIDKNDKIDQSYFGLDSFPVTIYYSKTDDIKQRVQLITNLPPKGIYKWNTKELPDGDKYNIIISAVDKSSETGESVSGNFTIDHTSPVFTVRSEPLVSLGEDVKIIIDSDKDIFGKPTVRVAQKDFNLIDVPISGYNNHFEGIYRVIGGYNGIANVSVNGQDLAGNESNLIISGGYFNVGVIPPTRPIIVTHQNNQILTKDTVDIKGKASKKSEIVLFINGNKKYNSIADQNGNFIISNIKLDSSYNYGYNFLNFISKDSSGNISEPTDLNLKLNIPPELFIDYPVNGQILSASTEILVKSSDKNNDKLFFDYEVSGDKGNTWSYVAKGIEDKKYIWNTTLFSDGEYAIRVTASDGISKKKFIANNLIIKNNLRTSSLPSEKVVSPLSIEQPKPTIDSFNNPPILKFLNPNNGTGLNHSSTILFQAYDPDGDDLKNIILSYKSPGDTIFKQLDINSIDNKFDFDVSGLKEDCGYQLRLETADNISISSSTVNFCVDNTPPKIFLNPVKKNIFKEGYKFEAGGYATDNFSGVRFVEYSFDEEHWFKSLIFKSFSEDRVDFKIKHPYPIDDGKYSINIRSVDYAGNYSELYKEKIVIDTVPPRLGSYNISVDGLSLYPENSMFRIIKGNVIDIEMSLESDTQSASLVVGNESIKLEFNKFSNTWGAQLYLNTVGSSTIKYNAIDGNKNSIEGKKIGNIDVIETGRVFLGEGLKVISNSPISGADIIIMKYDNLNNDFIKWNGEKYGIASPIKTNQDGTYRIILPSGRYKFLLKKDGLINLSTNEFELNNPRFLDTVFFMHKREGSRGYLEDILSKFIIF